MKLPISNLGTLPDNISMLNIQQGYVRTWILEKDECNIAATSFTNSLGGQINLTTPLMIKYGNRETNLECRLFSNYFIKAETVNFLKNIRNTKPTVDHFSLTPFVYSDSRYIYYLITAHDQNGSEVAGAIPENFRRINPCPPAQP